MRKTALLVSCLGLLFIAAACQRSAPTAPNANTSSADVAPRLNTQGVSYSPRSTDPVDILNFFSQVPHVGAFLSWAGTWSDLTKASGGPTLIVTKAKQFNVQPVIIVGFTAADVTSDARWQDVEDAVVAFAGAHQLPYLGLGNEVNKTFSSQVLSRLSARFEKTAKAVKMVSPQTRMFPTWQFEWLVGERGGLFGGQKTAAQWSLLKLFPTRDLTVFTTYPSLVFHNPADIPADYYTSLATHTTGPIAFTEIGWFRTGPTGWESSTQKQADFLQRFRTQIQSLPVTFYIWPFLYDPATMAPFNSMGLLEKSGATSAVYETWVSGT